MPPAPVEKTQPKTAGESNLFQVTKGVFGPFNKGHKFSRETLRVLHPLPKNAGDINHDEHIQAIIDRGLALGDLLPLPDDAGESATPPGVKPKDYSATFANATQAVLNQRAASSQAVQARPDTALQSAPAERPPVQHGGSEAATQPAQPQATQPAQIAQPIAAPAKK